VGQARRSSAYAEFEAAGCRARRLAGASFSGGGDLAVGGSGWKAIWLCRV